MMISPFSVAPAGAADPFWADVILMMGFNEANGATNFADDSPSGFTLTQAGSGGAAVDRATPKFDEGALATGGTTARARLGGASAFNMSGPVAFTVEFWARYSAIQTNCGFIAFNVDTGGGNAFQWAVVLTPSNILQFRVQGAGANSIDSALLSAAALDAWHYFAFQREANGRLSLWINGFFCGISGAPGSLVLSPPINSEMSIGYAQGWNFTANNGAAAQFDEVRVTKGVARYMPGGPIPVPTTRFPRS